MHTTESNIYRVRRTLGRSSRRAGAPRVAAELGLGRALDILQAERAKVKALLGR